MWCARFFARGEDVYQRDARDLVPRVHGADMVRHFVCSHVELSGMRRVSSHLAPLLRAALAPTGSAPLSGAAASGSSCTTPSHADPPLDIRTPTEPLPSQLTPARRRLACAAVIVPDSGFGESRYRTALSALTLSGI